MFYIRVFLIVFLFYNCKIVLGRLYPIEPRHSLLNGEFDFGVPRPDYPGSLWPLANKEILFWSRKYLNPANFRLISEAIDCDIISEALKRYKELLFLDGPTQWSKLQEGEQQFERLQGLKVIVNNYDPKLGHCGYPQMNDDESYSVKIFPLNPYAEITSETVWGALRGLETFSQLIYYNETLKLLIVNETTITDRPAFSHRGIMLDTSRHYISVDVLKSNLDAMAYNKFNVFHWHIVDDQSFPFQSQIYPNLSLLGAYTQKHIYTHDDVKGIINYARLRGIRVIPEFDSPSHTHSIGNAFPNLITPCYVDGKAHVANGDEYSEDEVLNPILEETYDFVKTILKEFRGLFKDNFVHLGMDETNLNCWASNPDINKFIQAKGMKSVMDLHEYYSERVLKIANDLGYKYVIWEDPLEGGVNVSKDAIIEVWKPAHAFRANSIVQRGYNVIISACWYLNLISYGPDWIQYYKCDPADFLDDMKYRNQVLGGEACLWAEYIDNNNLLETLWPRASAVAERLWYNATKTTAADAINRLDRHRCRMLRRGIETKPILNGYCGEFEVTPIETSVEVHELYRTILMKVPRPWEASHATLSIISILIVIMFFVKFGLVSKLIKIIATKIRRCRVQYT